MSRVKKSVISNIISMKNCKIYLELNYSLHFPLHIQVNYQLGDLLSAVVGEDTEVGPVVNVDMGLCDHDAIAGVIHQTRRKMVLAEKT